MQRIIIIDIKIIYFSCGAPSSFRLSPGAACGGQTGFSRMFCQTAGLEGRRALHPAQGGSEASQNQPNGRWEREGESRLQFAHQIPRCFASNTLDIHATSSCDWGTLAITAQTQGFPFPAVLVGRESGLGSENHKGLRGTGESRGKSKTL